MGKLWKSIKVALLIAIAGVGFLFIMNGVLKILPETSSGWTSILIGLGILLVLGFLGYNWRK